MKKATAIENRELSTLASKLYIRSEKFKPTEKKTVERKKKKKDTLLAPLTYKQNYC